MIVILRRTGPTKANAHGLCTHTNLYSYHVQVCLSAWRHRFQADIFIYKINCSSVGLCFDSVEYDCWWYAKSIDHKQAVCVIAKKKKKIHAFIKNRFRNHKNVFSSILKVSYKIPGERAAERTQFSRKKVYLGDQILH